MNEEIKVIEAFFIAAMVVGLTAILMVRQGILPSWKAKDKSEDPEHEKKEDE